jgi:hypothetical protein
MSPTFIWDLDLDDGRSPCPEGCGGLTEDSYGGACQRCENSWPASDEA